MTRLGTLRKRVLDGIGTRMALVLAVALLPLAIVSTIRSQTIIEQSQSRSGAALEGETLRAISGELGHIETTRGAAFALAGVMPQLLEDPAVCAAAMAKIVAGSEFSFAGFYTTERVITCSNTGEVVALAVDDAFLARVANPAPFVQVNRNAPVSEVSVIYASHPVVNADGTLRGFAAVSLPHSAIGVRDIVRPIPMRGDVVPDVAFFTLSPEGDVLTATGGDLADAGRLMPEGLNGPALVDRTGSFSAVSVEGENRTYSVVPVLGGAMFAMGTWPLDDVVEDTMFYRFPALFPFFMWAASLVVAYFAAEHLVTRHVRRLRATIRSFSETRRGFQVGAFDSAPVELRDMAVSYTDMTDTILREEAELEDNVRQKDVLLREVHHRVKNNLQLIASIMNMQMRKSRSEESRSLMRGLHDRVMSLATVHKGLYQTSGMADVRADELLGDILRQVTHIGTFNDEDIVVDQKFDPLHLSPEQAVPLTLLVTEALTNAVKYIGNAPGEKPRLKIRLRATADRKVRVQISNTLAPAASRPQAGPVGLGTQLLTAFSQQLHASLEKEVQGDWFIVTVNFEADALDTNGTSGAVF